MRPFQYVRPIDGDAAVAALAAPGAVPIGGGTDLVPLWREGLAAPATVVEVPAGADAVRETPDGHLEIAAGARLAVLAEHPVLTRRAAALAAACASVGSPALRAQGTLGGNLGQRPRCWYWRAGHACAKSGASGCPAVAGAHHHHAIVEGGPCWAVHPSDPAVALLALEAVLHVRSIAGGREIPIADFFVRPSDDPTRETVLDAGELITHVTVPPVSLDGAQTWDKVLQRGAWDFALVSLATVRRADGDVRLVLGGVGPRPWRVNDSIEEDVASGGLDDDSIEALAERALYDAEPLPGTRYKVAQARTLLVRAMRRLGGARP
ncbi:MAG: FAD binding domain-containing protein [Gemmatimonadaceae bacterium]|nr:FAD binding domain-containing protein [Gemmatimonadaceae bacterium]